MKAFSSFSKMTADPRDRFVNLAMICDPRIDGEFLFLSLPFAHPPLPPLLPTFVQHKRTFQTKS